MFGSVIGAGWVRQRRPVGVECGWHDRYAGWVAPVCGYDDVRDVTLGRALRPAKGFEKPSTAGSAGDQREPPAGAGRRTGRGTGVPAPLFDSAECPTDTTIGEDMARWRVSDWLTRGLDV